MSGRSKATRDQFPEFRGSNEPSQYSKMEIHGRHTKRRKKRGDFCSHCQVQEWYEFIVQHNTFINCAIKGPPTQAKAYKVLLEKEIENQFSGRGNFGDAHFINTGLRLERDQ
jgi:hypothetical protein